MSSGSGGSASGSVRIDINEFGQDEKKSPLSSKVTKIPDLMDIWNKTADYPYTVTIERPFTMLGTSTYQYSFVCKREQNDPKLLHTFNCEIRIRKVLTEEGGTSATAPEDEVMTDFKAVYCDETCYILRCTMLKRKIWLRKRLSITCEYIARDSGSCWVLTGSVNDIQSLFTLNRTGEGLGPLAEYLSSTNTISFFTNRMEMKIQSSYGNWTFAQGKMEPNILPVAQQTKNIRRKVQNRSVDEQQQQGGEQEDVDNSFEDFPSDINGNTAASRSIDLRAAVNVSALHKQKPFTNNTNNVNANTAKPYSYNNGNHHNNNNNISHPTRSGLSAAFESVPSFAQP